MFLTHIRYGLGLMTLLFCLTAMADPTNNTTSGAGEQTPVAAGSTTATTATAKPAALASPLQRAYKRNLQLRKQVRENRAKLARLQIQNRSLEQKLLKKNEKVTVDDLEFSNAKLSKPAIDHLSARLQSADGGFSWLWLLISFAMLGIGFWAGVAWLQRRHRKRLGGMHLRV